MVNRIWPTAVAGKADSVSSVSASACHIGGPNSVNPGQILLVYGNRITLPLTKAPILCITRGWGLAVSSLPLLEMASIKNKYLPRFLQGYYNYMYRDMYGSAHWASYNSDALKRTVLLQNFTMVNRIWPTAVAGEADSVSSVSASACHIGGPNSVNPGQILLVYGIGS